MNSYAARNKYWLGILAIVSIGVLIALNAFSGPAKTPPPKLIPPASIYHAPPTGGGPAWGGSAWVPSPFRRAQLHHPWCGRRISPQIRGIHGIYRMRFARCTMAFGPIKIYARATPRPSYRPPPPTVRPLPTSPAPAVTPLPTSGRPTPIPTRLPPAPIPIATAITPGGASNDSAAYELSLMNQSRASAGLPPYTLNPAESAGTATCPGSQGHADHMAQVGSISHDQFPADICVAYSAAGENVGEAGGYGVLGALDIIHQQMMAETPFSYGCTGSHRCNIMSPSFHQVGIGITTVNGTTFMTVDFIGP